MNWNFPVGNIVRSNSNALVHGSTWWIHANMDQHSVPPSRLRMKWWIAENYGALHNILAGL